MSERVGQCADSACSGEPVAEELLAAVRALADAVRRHNLREEELLRDLIPAVDAWGHERAEVMTEEHVREHDELYQSLLGTPCTPPEFAGAGVRLLLGELLEHLEHEERAFLNEDVLRDDAVLADPQVG